MPGQRRSSRSTSGRLPEQELVALAGRGAVEVIVADPMLIEEYFADDTAQFHRLHVLTEHLQHLFARDTEHTAGHHRLDSGLGRTPVEAVGIVGHKLARERKPRDMFPVVADAVSHILEATIRHEA